MRVLMAMLCVTCMASMTPAQGALPASVAQALSAAGIPDSSVSLFVQDVTAREPVITHGPDRALNPASTMKLVTTYAALDLLGPAYTWQTDVHATGPMRNDVLAGDLVIRGSGDPELTLENLWLLLRNLRGRGVREIRGDVVIDRSYFAPVDHDPARFDNDPIRPYNTGADALLVNYKAVTVHFVPEDGRHLRMIVDPTLEGAQVVNGVSLVEGACGDWVSRLRFDAQGTPDATRLVISGPYARDCGERSRSFSLLSHHAYTASLLAQMWRELGGTMTGTVREGRLPPGTRLLASARSPALAEIVRDINKFSNNVMARQLFLTVGAVGAGAPATLEKAQSVVQQWLAQKGLSSPELSIDNGAGLSRTARISARSLGELLLHAFRSPVMSEFMSSLPVIAADGTMRKRLTLSDLAGQAHIKGGTLAGVRAIAGYVLDEPGRRRVVVFIVNHPNAAHARNAQDALLRWVHDGR